jgi:hypothetical protein
VAYVVDGALALPQHADTIARLIAIPPGSIVLQAAKLWDRGRRSPDCTRSGDALQFRHG